MKLPQLSLRDLFWLVALVAMGCGWWVSENRSSRERKRLAAEVDEARQDRGDWQWRAEQLKAWIEARVSYVVWEKGYLEISKGTDHYVTLRDRTP